MPSPFKYIIALLIFFAPQESKAMVAVQEITSQTGITAWLIEDHAVPLVTVNFMVKGGSSSDAPDKAGLTNVALQMLMEGAGSFDALAFNQQLDEYAVRLGFSPARDFFTGTLQTLTANLPKAVELTKLVLTQPRLEKTALARVIAQQLASLQFSAQNPAQRAQKLWWKNAFPHHPYSLPTEGLPETVKKITLKDVQAFTQTRLAKNNLIIGIAGAVTPAEAAKLVDDIFGSLTAQKTAVAAPVQPLKKHKESIIEKMPLPQSVVVFGQTGVRRTDKNYYAATLLNYILGGGSFSSRLMDEVREKRGLTYGIYTALSETTAEPLILGQISTANATVNQALTLTKDIIGQMAKNGVTTKELQDAKDHENGSFPLDLDNTERLASLASAMQYYNLPKDFLVQRESLINAVTLEQINHLAATVLHPDNLLVTIVGNPAP